MEKIATKTTKRINTLQFGEIEIEEKHVFHFDYGMLGFEDLREFVLISDEETVPFRWLISVENPEIGFPVLSPWHIDLTYNPGRDFNIDREVIFVVITLEDGKGHMSANMKAPVVLDVVDQTGRQVILPTDKYLPNFIIPNK